MDPNKYFSGYNLKNAGKKQKFGYAKNVQFGRVKSVQSALSDLKHPPERLQSQCNYRPFIT